ncbi:MAG TPA: FkbM family methyltransferase [Micropepsaceae bacterium]|nr:FkbM family methyltransferase [Micropepsaceae bacterium]
MSSHPSWLATALEHQRAGRLSEAERLYNEAVQANSAQADALHLLGLIAASRNEFGAAEHLIGQAISVKPERGDFHASLGNLFFARQMIEEMTRFYRQALLLTYFSAIPAPFSEIIAHAGSDSASSDFSAQPEQYKSQYLQDVLLDRWLFAGLTAGTFVDVGAHDGVTFSNSYFFETVRNWQGVAIEPNPSAFAKAAAVRKCTVLNCGVSDQAGTLPFLKISGYPEMLSGLVDRYHPEHRQRIEEELRRFGGASEVIPVETCRLNDIAVQCGLKQIHYLSIDTEGSELLILQSIDFQQLLVHAITVEYNFESVKAQMIALMQERGFDCVQTLGHDLVFLNRGSPFHARFRRLRQERKLHA